MMVAVAIGSVIFVGENFVEVLSVCNSWSYVQSVFVPRNIYGMNVFIV